MILVSISYAIFLVALVVYERYRTRKSGPDILTLFVIFFVIQAVIPPLFVTSILTVYSPNYLDTGLNFYNRVLADVSPLIAEIVMVLSACFMCFVYLTWTVLKQYVGNEQTCRDRYALTVRPLAWFGAMVLALVFAWLLLQPGGGGIEGYKNLILFRSVSENAKNYTATSNIYAFLQVIAWTPIIGLVRYGKGGWRRPLFWLAVVMALFMAVMTVSRRTLVIDAILIYFTIVLVNRKYYFRYLAIIVLISLPITIIGKSLLNYFPIHSRFDLQDFLWSFWSANYLGQLTGYAMDIGRTVSESWATLIYLHLPPRFGVDTLLSLLRQWPGHFLGIVVNWPERIVRISTAAFMSPNSVDLPPGLMGQMWLDFRFIGPVMWGAGFGLQIGILQWIYNRSRMAPDAIIAYLLFVYLFFSIMSSGSYDFLFNVASLFLVLILLFIVKIKLCRRGQISIAARISERFK